MFNWLLKLSLGVTNELLLLAAAVAVVDSLPKKFPSAAATFLYFVASILEIVYNIINNPRSKVIKSE